MAKRYGKSDAGSETASTTKTTGGFFSKERIEARKKANKEKAKKRHLKLYPNSTSANEKASVAKGKANAAATKKMYAAESMFKSKAKDKAKTSVGKARSFKDAFDSATKSNKERFLYKGKGFLTTKGKRADRFPVTTDKKKPADKKLNIFQKFTKKMRGTNADGSTRTQKEYEAARKKRQQAK